MEALVARVIAAAPNIEETGANVDEIITAVIEQAGAANMELENGAKDGFGANLAVAFMAQGAMAAILEGFPPDNARTHCYRAGRAIGAFMVARWQEGLRDITGQVPKEN